MSARTFTVLAPNGRRQTVKCNLNTTILQILEEVCKKQGFEPPEYDIKHHNKALDTSMTVQFSGLPNNAQLELGPATKTRAESEITLALNFENGDRIFGTFVPSDTLKDVLEALDKNPQPNPIVIYMRRELYGDDLIKTDLKSLGLTGGRAMFRVIYRDPEELKKQANVSSIIPPKPVVEKPYKRVFQPLEPEIKTVTDTQEPKEGIEKVLPTPKNTPLQPDILKLAKERKHLEENESKNEDRMQEEHIKPNKGRTIIKEGRKSIPKSENTSKNNDKLQNNELENVKMEDFPFTCERKGLIFPLDSAHTHIREEPPDDFFELTLDDAKTILRDVRRMREEAEEGGPLLTSALRELEESKKQLRQLNRYSKSIIRILFPDRTVLQGVFSSTDSISTVHDFVKEHLLDSNIPFHLYTAPPKYILPEDKRLIEVDCVPGALLHFGTEEQFKNCPNFFREDLKEKFTTNSMASLAVLKIREEIKRSRSDEIQAGCSKENDTTKRNSTNSNEKVPKWFKGK